MFSTVNAIALRTTRHSDRTSILSAWTLQNGRISIAMPSPNSREGRRRAALTSPLAAFQAEMNFRPDRDIQSVRDLAPAPASLAMAPGTIRQITAAFLADVCDRALRRSDPDIPLYNFLYLAAKSLATQNPVNPLFTHIFLLNLLEHCGISPNLPRSLPAYFDLREATCLKTPPLHPDYLLPECTRIAAILAILPFDTSFKLPQYIRNEALDAILHYYTLHLTPLDNLKSLQILKQLR